MDVWTEPTPYTVTVQSGLATYMAPGRMEQVLTNRGLQLNGRIPVALNRAGDLGRYVWIEWPDGTIYSAVVVDCAQREHYRARAQDNRIVEVSAEIAQARGFYDVGPSPVKVWYRPPPYLHPRKGRAHAR